MNNPFEYVPGQECNEAFGQLLERLETLRGSKDPVDTRFIDELDSGKMLGVLIARDTCGVHHTLYAFSGQLGDYGFNFPGFVGPVFDYLQPDGYFKIQERNISRQSAEIEHFEKTTLTKANEEYNQVKDAIEEEVAQFKQKCRRSKQDRDAKRNTGCLSEDEAMDLIRQSQFEKAELRRLKKRMNEMLAPYAARLEETHVKLEDLKQKRHIASESLQHWLFSNMTLLNARGDTKSIGDIFADTPMSIPPSGAGECCAPKLLQEAYLKGWTPVSIAEYWYGCTKEDALHIHGSHYPACRGKCLPVLNWMLKGLTVDPPLDKTHCREAEYNPRIVFENRWFCVVEKPCGMLSVPGNVKLLSMQQWLESRYGPDKGVRMAHRLDQDTSGLMIATFGELSYKTMQSLFARQKVKKTYVAELEGDYRKIGIPLKGRIELPISADWMDRPRQRIDFENGKDAVTVYEFTGVEENRSRIVFHPLTGRTHQLRVHAASHEGLNMPIAGDRLYGANGGASNERLSLHASKIEFTFPLDGLNYSFESPSPFK